MFGVGGGVASPIKEMQEKAVSGIMGASENGMYRLDRIHLGKASMAKKSNPTKTKPKPKPKPKPNRHRHRHRHRNSNSNSNSNSNDIRDDNSNSNGENEDIGN